MSDAVAAQNGVTTQYLARVADDLEQNLKEQERLGTEIAVLQSRLAELEEDRTVLLSLQEALGATSAPAAPDSEPALAPEPAPAPEPAQPPTGADEKATAAPARKARAKKTASAPDTNSAAAPDQKAGKNKTAAKKSPEPRQPSLVTLARDFLTSQTEPRSAAEIAEALAQAHRDRDIKKTVVRTTLEGLVAKNHAQRSKQGTSVFYTAPDPAEPSADDSRSSGPAT